MNTELMQQCLDKVSKEFGVADYNVLKYRLDCNFISHSTFDSLIFKAMQLYSELYARDKCEKQKISCADSIVLGQTHYKNWRNVSEAPNVCDATKTE